VIEFTFRRSCGTWFVKTHVSGTLSSIGTENALEHPNAPIVPFNEMGQLYINFILLMASEDIFFCSFLGIQLDKYIGYHRELDDGAESVGLSRGCVCGWRHCQTASKGSQEV